MTGSPGRSPRRSTLVKGAGVGPDADAARASVIDARSALDARRPWSADGAAIGVLAAGGAGGGEHAIAGVAGRRIADAFNARAGRAVHVGAATKQFLLPSLAATGVVGDAATPVFLAPFRLLAPADARATLLALPVADVDAAESLRFLVLPPGRACRGSAQAEGGGDEACSTATRGAGERAGEAMETEGVHGLLLARLMLRP